jgi:hypothetical protein
MPATNVASTSTARAHVTPASATSTTSTATSGSEPGLRRDEGQDGNCD